MMSRHTDRDRETVYLITPLAEDFPVDLDADYIGVDAGFQKIEAEKLPLKTAIGDFDSMDDGAIPAGATVLPVAKDETDSEMAMKTAVEMGYRQIILWGGLSGRLDHTLANLRLIAWQYPQVILQDRDHKAFVLCKGIHTIPATYTHLSLFALEPSVISESGVGFPLDQAHVNQKQIYTVSNFFTDEQAVIEIHQGRVLCILSNVR